MPCFSLQASGSASTMSGRSVHPLVMLEEGEEPRRFRARARAGQDPGEDGLPPSGVDKGADERPPQIPVGEKDLEEGADIRPHGRELPFVPEGPGQSLGVLFNEGQIFH